MTIVIKNISEEQVKDLEWLFDSKVTRLPPHGDLIDRDAVYKRIHKAIDDDPQLSDVYVEDAQIVTEWLRTETPIIESEDGE